MNEQLKDLIENYKQTDWKALLREDLGQYHLKEIKPLLDFVKKFIDPLVESPHKLSPNQQNLLIQLLDQFVQHKESIKTHVNTSQNQNIINSIVGFKDWILDSFQTLSGALEIQAKHGSDESLDKPKVEIKKYQLAREEFEKELKKLQQTQSQYAEQAKRKEVERYGDFFKREAGNNKKLSRLYGVILFSSSVSACVFAHFFLKFDQNITASNAFDLIIKGNLINKIFIFTIIILLISILKREYLALKHQYTLNRHRHNALSSHKEILSSIQKTASGSDKEISNAILLELTKAMFSPQNTGFVKDQKDTSSENRIVEISKSFFNTSKE